MMNVEVWLYGPLARYGGSDDNIAAQIDVELPAGSTLGELLAQLALPTEERGITFINGDLSAMPGLQPDLGHVLAAGDRVALFHQKSMWPFQYRHDVAMVSEMQTAVEQRQDKGRRSRFDGD
ncbi:MAG: MoaD/ThiS family protein [Chloroflexota bacterium]|nr:MoaD/ThiS family protein [Chloroflexota bacterium]